MIKKVLCNQRTPRISKLKNGSILAMIESLIKCKEIDINFVKVKGHSGVYFNEQVDKLAKEGCKDGEVISWNIEWSKLVRVVPRWNQYIIDTPIRGLIDSITNLYYSVEWLHTSSIEYLESKNSIESEIDWKEIWQNF
ncbi:hypothetical protein C2G38_2121577, partial [Gigaspora rosea]